MKHAEIIAVGSELLTPYRLDTNSLFLTGELNEIGMAVIRKNIVPDDRAALREAFRQALERADLVVATGGLGPTEDDVTREALADLLERPLVLDEHVLREIRERFIRRGRTMTPNNERQALVPQGATVFPNAFGTAPGLWIEAGDHVVVLLPGPPSELRPIFHDQVRPLVERRTGARRMAHRLLRAAGASESQLDHRISPIYQQYEDVETTILATPEGIEIHLTLWSEDPARAGRRIEELSRRMMMALGESVFSANGETLDEVVARDLQFTGVTVAVAESCTGGLVSARLTNIPGSSIFFRGGIVSYSNQMKAAWVGVPAELIERHGAVSAEVAIALAEGVRHSAASTLGIGITGIAGPGGGSPEKPVGTVHMALADGMVTSERLFRFGGDRARIRHLASQTALDMIRRYLDRARQGRG